MSGKMAEGLADRDECRLLERCQGRDGHGVTEIERAEANASQGFDVRDRAEVTGDVLREYPDIRPLRAGHVEAESFFP